MTVSSFSNGVRGQHPQMFFNKYQYLNFIRCEYASLRIQGRSLTAATLCLHSTDDLPLVRIPALARSSGWGVLSPFLYLRVCTTTWLEVEWNKLAVYLNYCLYIIPQIGNYILSSRKPHRSQRNVDKNELQVLGIVLQLRKLRILIQAKDGSVLLLLTPARFRLLIFSISFLIIRLHQNRIVSFL